MQSNIQKALEHLKNADYADYFGEIDKIDEDKLSISLLSHFNKLKKEFITSGSLDAFFVEKLEVLTKEIKKFLDNGIKDLNSFSETEDDFRHEGHILDQIYYSLKRFEEIPHLPSFLIKDLYPFKSENKDEHIYVSSFYLVIQNQRLAGFFENIEVSGGKQIVYKKEEELKQIESYQEKLDFIIAKLNQFLIYYIEIEGHREVKNIMLWGVDCDCVFHSYRRFNFKKSLEQLEIKNPKGNLKALNNAFTHFLFGNYHHAYKLYQELAERFKTEGKYILHFICQYNVKKIGIHIGYLWEDNFEENRALSKEIDKQINLDDIQETLKLYKKQNEILSLIKNREVIDYVFYNVTNISRDIIQNYHNRLKGGASSNNKVVELRAEMAKLDMFYTENRIIFEHFQEFKNTVSIAIEGFIASYAILENQPDTLWKSSRLDVFDSYLLLLMWRHGEPRDLQKYFKKYKVESIKYNGNNNFEVSVNNFLDLENNFQYIIEQIKDKHTFKDKYNRYLKNLLILLSYINLHKERFEDITIKIIGYLIQNKELIRDFNYEFINLFFYKNFKLFDNKKLCSSTLTFLKFLIFEVRNKDSGYYNSLIRNLVGIVEKYYNDVKFIDLEDLKRIIDIYQNKENYLFDLLPIISEDLKYLIKDKIEASLEESFQNRLAYNATISYLFEPFTFLDKFLETKDYIYIINIAHKFDLDLSEEKFDIIRQDSDFFEWLMKPRSFNYQKFDVHWFKDRKMLGLYNLDNLRYIPQIAQMLAEYLKHNRQDEFLQDIYFEYFVDDFDVEEFVDDIYKRREESGKLHAKKMDELFKDI